MKKRLVLSVIILFALMLTSCAPAAAPAAEEEAPAAEEEAPAAEEEAPAEEAAAEEEAAPKCVPATCEDEPVEAVSAADVEAACAGEHGCAVIPAGETVKIGMSSPMTGPYADFGIDAENSGLLAVADACGYAGFNFELVAEDDEGD